MNGELSLRANAKINLSLKVLNLRKDGFHNLDTIMQSISVHDLVNLKLTDGPIKIKCDNPDVPSDESNLAYKAAELYFTSIEMQGRGVEITIKKSIPVAAGLGGGSADAAAVLHGLNVLFGSKLHKDKLFSIAAQIGADVPFLLAGGIARCTGRGEKISKINPKGGNAYILAIPDVKISAKEVYDGYDELKSRDSSLINALEQVTMMKFKEIKKLKNDLEQATGLKWVMSGSGPVLFTEFSDLSEVDGYVERVKKFCKCSVAMKMNEGISVLGDQ